MRRMRTCDVVSGLWVLAAVCGVSIAAFCGAPRVCASEKAVTTAPAGEPTSRPARFSRDYRGRPGSMERHGRGDWDSGPDERPGEREGDRDGERRGDRDRMGWGRGRASPEEIEKLMAFVKENFPELHDKLDRARESDPMAFRYMLHRAREMMIHFEHADPSVRKTMIAEHKVMMEIRRLKDNYRFASPDKREGIQTALRVEIEKRFTYRQERLRQEIEHLRDRLDEQSRRLEEQERNKAQVIEDELKEMITDIAKPKHPEGGGKPKPKVGFFGEP